MKSTLGILAKEGQLLKQNTETHKASRPKEVPMEWKFADTSTSTKPVDSIALVAVTSKILKSSVTNSDDAQWLAKPVTMKVANYKACEPTNYLSRPKGYWIPASCDDAIARIKWHGITMKTSTDAQEISVEMHRITDYKFEDYNHKLQPFEEHRQVNAKTKTETHKQLFLAGSVYISTDQPLGDLALLLLEPASKDSFFNWGFFHSVFQRTEYIEAYIRKPLAKKMLENSPDLQKGFEPKKAQDKAFANYQNAMLTWFYSETK